MKSKCKINIPNLLSIIRIILVPFIVLCFLKDKLLLSLVLLALSALSDVADGKIARKYNQITDLGKILDPIADKMTMFAVVICLWIKYGREIQGLSFLFCVLLGKDLLMLIGSTIFFNLIKKPVGSLWYGKMSTVIFYAVALAIILLDIFSIDLALKNTLIFILVLIAALAAVMAFILYFIFAYKTYKQSRSEGNVNSQLSV